MIATVPVVMMRRRITVWRFRVFLGNPFLKVGDEATLLWIDCGELDMMR